MHQPAAGGSPLSIHRAFVVQFRDGTDAARGRVTGRIEHVASRETASFRSWSELRTFMAKVLSKVSANSPEVSR